MDLSSSHSDEHPRADRVRKFGRYTLGRELGRGTFGVVYMAHKEGIERPFALKVLLGEAIKESEARQRFEREASIAAKVDDPGVVAVYDIGTERDRPYYVMEYCEGRTLAERIKQEGPLDPTEAAQLVSELAATMARAHQRGVIHRDLKPANVILQGDRARIMDFGLAKDVTKLGLTRTGEALGTPYYMAPEQVRGEKDLDARVDLYALGVILYESLTGKIPFPGENFLEVAERVQRGWPVPPRQIRDGIPKTLEAICLRAMSIRREDRHLDAETLRADLAEFLLAEEEQEEGERSILPWLVAATVGACVVLLFVIGGLIVSRQSRFNEARALLQRAALERGAKADGLLERALALAEGDEQLRAQVAETRTRAAVEAFARRLEDMLEAGATASAIRNAFSDLPEHARAAASAKAHAVVDRILADVRAREALASEDLLGTLDQAHALAAGDSAREEAVRLARRRIRARRALEESRRLSARGQLEPARAAVDRARSLAPSGGRLAATIQRERRKLDVRGMLLATRRLSARKATLKALLERLTEAERLAGDDAALKAEVDLARVTCRYRRGQYEAAARQAATLSSQPGRTGFVARYLRGMCLFRLERSRESDQVLRAVWRDDPRGVGGLLAGAFLETVMSPGGAAQGERLARKALELEPDNADARISLAFSLNNQRRLPEAWREAKRALREAPDHPRAYLAKGYIRMSLRDPRGALDAYTRLIELTEPRPMLRALRRRAQLRHQLGRARPAIADLTRLLELAPNDVSARVLRGVYRDQLGQPAKAVADWRHAARTSKQAFEQIVRGLGQQWGARIRRSLGEKVTASGGAPLPEPKPAKVPPGLEAARNLARSSAPLAKVLAALTKAEADAELGSGRARVQLERADVYYRRGLFQKALAATAPLIERADAIGYEAHVVRGFTCLWLGKGAECLRTFRTVWEKDRRGVHGLNGGAAFFTLSGRTLQGERLARRAAQLDPTYVESYITLTFNLSMQSHPKRREAKALIAKVIPLAKDHPRAHVAQAFCARSLGDLEGAFDAAGRAIAVTPGAPLLEALRIRAAAALGLKRGRQALADAETMLKQNSRDLQAHLLKGLAHDQLAQPKLAKAAWLAGFAADQRRFLAIVRRTGNHALRAKILRIYREKYGN